MGFFVFGLLRLKGPGETWYPNGKCRVVLCCLIFFHNQNPMTPTDAVKMYIIYNNFAIKIADDTSDFPKKIRD